MVKLLAAGIVFALSAGGLGQEAASIYQEPLDLATIARIREEGLHHSHVMWFASGLSDGIGARLTASPAFEQSANWCIAQLRDMGVHHSHEESWGSFGMPWTQIGTTLLLVEPQTATMVAQATPWSPPTPGEVNANVILVPKLHSRQEFAGWKGKLAGKVILYGEAPVIHPDPKPPMVQLTPEMLAAKEAAPVHGDSPRPHNLAAIRQVEFDATVASFFAAEHAVAVLRTNGEGNTFTDDTFSSMGWFVYQARHRQPLPSAVVAPDAYGRMARLLARNVPVRVRLNIATKLDTADVDGNNVLGEIPGTDPLLKDQIVLFGAHLDSWVAGTGATDDGAGVVIALEAMRILTALHLKPRRTIRVGLWGGEEEGELGSLGYVEQNFATVQYSEDPEQRKLPLWVQTPVSITPKGSFNQLDVYFNVDAGGGRFYGIHSEGNMAAARIFRQWAAPLKDLNFQTITVRHMESIDSENFVMVGLPGFEFGQDLRDYDTRTHHTNLDTYERLSEPDLKQAATIMAVFLYNAAQQDAMFPRKPLGE